jgi:RNA polymerase sigma factor (sigma-70 family)
LDANSLIHNELENEASAVLAALFQQHRTALCAYLSCLVNDWETARDLTQETFLRAFRARRQLLQVDNRRAWLYRIATNLAIDANRRQRRWQWLPWHGIDAVGDFTAQQADLNLAVAEALAALPVAYRAPLLLYSAYGFSVREVAEALDLGHEAVKTRLYRARKMFRQVYGDEDHDSP